MGFYEDLGVRPVINAAGSLTRLGGNKLAPGVVEAMRELGIDLKGMTVEYLLNRCVSLKRGDHALMYAAAGGVGSLEKRAARIGCGARPGDHRRRRFGTPLCSTAT